MRVGDNWAARLVCGISLLAFATPASTSETLTYMYDARGRLVKVTHSGSVNNGVSSDYTYDKADNRTNVTVTTGAPLGPAFSISDVAATEGSSLVFTVTKSGTTSNTVGVDIGTTNGSGVAGTDYTATSTTLSFAAAETSKTVTVPSIGNGIVDGTRKFYANLSNPSGGAGLSDSQGLGTINDDEVAVIPSFAVADVSATEGNSITFTVAKTGLTNLTYTIDYATSSYATGFPATLGSDYSAASGTLTFGPSDTQKTITVSTVADTIPENNEIFAFELARASGGATISDNAAVGTILNNDGTGISIGDGGGTEGDLMTVSVTRVGDTSATMTVNWATANGTAIAPGDYTAGSGTLTFSAGITSRAINIQTSRQLTQEGDEFFVINLTPGSGTYTITKSQGGVTIADYIQGCNPPPGQEPSC